MRISDWSSDVCSSDLPFVVVAEEEAALELAADAAQRGGGEHALGRAARSHIDVDIGFGVGRRDDARDVAVGDQRDAAADRTQLGDDRFMARAVEHADDELLHWKSVGEGKSVSCRGQFGGCRNIKKKKKK